MFSQDVTYEVDLALKTNCLLALITVSVTASDMSMVFSRDVQNLVHSSVCVCVQLLICACFLVF